jgi:hypothetical protein
MFKGGRVGGCVGVASVQRELVDVAEVDRLTGRRRKAEYVEPVQRKHHDRESQSDGTQAPPPPPHSSSPADTGELGSISA